MKNTHDDWRRVTEHHPHKCILLRKAADHRRQGGRANTTALVFRFCHTYDGVIGLLYAARKARQPDLCPSGRKRPQNICYVLSVGAGRMNGIRTSPKD
eukprot:6200076-Pleurochrysis_carterae.AAC.13